ncbi:MAG: HAMP domain-containing sensor histidine kinase [Negativicutes bacterium]|nr:HAMP domain-containing sensor histidine kinase [Negativicutes bacterium]
MEIEPRFAATGAGAIKVTEKTVGLDRKHSLLSRLIILIAFFVVMAAAVGVWLSIYHQRQNERKQAEISACNEIIALSLTLKNEQPAGILNFINERQLLNVFNYEFYDHGIFFTHESKFRNVDISNIKPDMACQALVSPELARYLSSQIGAVFFGKTIIEIDNNQYIIEKLGNKTGNSDFFINVIALIYPSSLIFPACQLLCSVVLLALVMMAGWGARCGFRRRIDALNQVFEQLRQGDTTVRPQIDGQNDEISYLSSHVSAALDRISTLIRQVHLITNEVAHEIRRPLTPIFHKIWEVNDRIEDIYIRELLDDVYNRMILLKNTLNELLDFGARIGLGDAIFDRFDSIDISDLLNDVLNKSQEKFDEKGVKLERKIDNNIYAIGSLIMLRIVFDNIIDNAIKYTSTGTVNVVLERLDSQNFSLLVRDMGPGIGGETAGRLSTPFYRAASASHITGHGLGMTLILDIAAHLGFAVSYRDRVDVSGCEVQVTGAMLPSGNFGSLKKLKNKAI